MSAPTETNKNTTDSSPESPTTARPFEMDDDDIQDSSMLADDTNTTNTAPAAATTATTSTTAGTTTTAPASTEQAPPKPPRPVSEAQKNELILKEAFPGVEAGVIKAVLRASGGHVEPAFNALLEMTDPDAVQREPEDAPPPPQPPRPQGRSQMSQLEADELYARQLAQHYDNVGAYESRTSNRGQPNQQRDEYYDDDREHSFIDDDLPVIRENLRKGFIETQTKVNGWITNIRKRIEEEFNENQDGSQTQQQHQRRPGDNSRRSNDYDRYDADPQVLGDDFANINLNADGSARTGANAGVFRPPPPSASPRPNDGRRVAFKEDTEEINMYDSSPKVPPKDSSPAPGKASKWQPLSSVDPNPISDNDPFSLGDSEDEKETKDKPKDAKLDENERLKKAAAEAMADSLVDPAKEEGSAAKKT